MLEAFSSTTCKQDYETLNSQIRTHLTDVYVKISTPQQLESRVFLFLDAELGIRRTPFEARNYKKLLQSLQKTKLISGRCLDTLMKKADRFLSSKNIEKEKEAYKQNIREQLLINPNATAVKLA